MVYLYKGLRVRIGFWEPGGTSLFSLIMLLALFPGFAGCGKDSCIAEPEPVAVTVEFGEGVEITSAAGTHIRLFDDYDPIWDDEELSAAFYGGWTHRTCRHGWPAGECPTCYPNDGAYLAGREDVGYG